MIANFRRRRQKCPECLLPQDRHEEWCSIGRCYSPRRDELNDSSGCGPWVLLFVGFIGVFTAIGISLIIISTELPL